jgi:predicted tellurium resistance membrane protein TerC
MRVIMLIALSQKLHLQQWLPCIMYLCVIAISLLMHGVEETLCPITQDEASTSGSDMDDEDMDRLGIDAKIAAVLRGTADAKASAQKAKEAMSQLRYRVRSIAGPGTQCPCMHCTGLA